MTDTPIRVGIVGANAERGWAKDAHVPALARLPQYFLEAVSARSQAIADTAAAAFGAQRAFADSLALASDPDIDLIVVTVKVPEHLSIVMAALDAGKHIYCEWPLGRDLKEAVRMTELADCAVGQCVVGLQGLSAPAIRHAATLARSGALGKLHLARVLSPTAGWGSQAPPNYAYLQDKRNGATLETVAGGHTLAAVECIVGSYLEVDARKSTFHPQVGIIGTDEVVERSCADHMIVLGRHNSGCVSRVEIAGGSPTTPFLLEVVGENGSIRITGGGPGGYQVGTLTLETDIACDPPPAPAVPGLSGPPANIAECYARFSRQIDSRSPKLPGFAQGVHLTALLDAIDIAATSGQRQAMEA